MSDQYDPYAPPPMPVPPSYPAPEPLPIPTPATDLLSAPEPLVANEPVPALAGGLTAPPDSRLVVEGGSIGMERVFEEIVAWLKTLASAAVYATLIVTFGFQVARVEGHSMAPTLADQDRLIVNKLAYRIGEPHIGDIVML
jgi:hypothetical protein